MNCESTETDATRGRQLKSGKGSEVRTVFITIIDAHAREYVLQSTATILCLRCLRLVRQGKSLAVLGTSPLQPVRIIVKTHASTGRQLRHLLSSVLPLLPTPARVS